MRTFAPVWASLAIVAVALGGSFVAAGDISFEVKVSGLHNAQVSPAPLVAATQPADRHAETLLAASNGVECTMCKMIAKAAVAYVSDHKNATCATIVTGLQSVCDHVPGFVKPICLRAVSVFGSKCPSVISLLTQKATPDVICQKITMCSGLSQFEFGELESLDICWPWQSCFKCKGCKFVLGKVVSQIASKGCALVDVELTGICELAFGGPEDPLSELCAGAMIAACPLLAKEIAGKITDPERLCHDVVHWC